MQDQAGVASRRQLLETGLTDHDIRRLVRRREMAPIGRGVYVGHTGVPTWEQRAWAAVLALWPAALWGPSALRAFEGSGKEDVIHVAVELHRNVASPRGVVVHRQGRFNDVVAWHLGPPRVGYDESVLDVAIGQRREVDTVAVLANAVGARRTTAGRLRTALSRRGRVSRRAWLEKVLEDIGAGTWSVLELAYLERVERPHGLPHGRRQFRHVGPGGTRYRDVDLDWAVIELDGRLHHSGSRQRDQDLERDLETAAEGRRTIRLGWGQVYDRPCQTAGLVAVVLRSAGWGGEPHTCSPQCAAV